jgi:hypothetical protein
MACPQRDYADRPDPTSFDFAIMVALVVAITVYYHRV